ncbi:hypothetical protein SM124_11870 [Bacillus sp. 31A1R]|uniref:Uncharacterized protein n=1 Tax=Robertmurraya mangrovi TaxID=3098077 RepID=A0ABU5IZ82_9BACI|nr:hypothetical protein [Bacillus sp. 31A1R]
MNKNKFQEKDIVAALIEKAVILMYRNNNLAGLGIIAILITSIYTAILASLLMKTKERVDYIYHKERSNKDV